MAGLIMFSRLCNVESDFNAIDCWGRCTCTQAVSRSIVGIGTFAQAHSISTFISNVDFTTITNGSQTGVKFGQQWLYNYGTSTWSIIPYGPFYPIGSPGCNAPLSESQSIRKYFYSSNETVFMRSQTML